MNILGSPKVLSRCSLVQTLSRYDFALLMFFSALPVVISFLAPAVLYRWPIGVHAFVGGQDVTIFLRKEVLWAGMAYFVAWVCVFALTAYMVKLILSRLDLPVMDVQFLVESKLQNKLWRVYKISSVLGLMLALIHNLTILPATMEQAVHQLSFLPLCSIGLAIYLSRGGQGRLSRWGQAFFLFLNVFSGLLVPLILGKAAPVIYGVLVVMLIASLFRVRLRLSMILTAIAVMVFSMILKVEVREQIFKGGAGFERVPISNIWSGRTSLISSHDIEATQRNSAGVGVGARARAFGKWDPNYERVRWMPLDGWFKYAVARPLHRVNHLGEFAFVLEKTPEAIPYSGMATYFPIFYAAVPRALFPEKPANISGQYFGHRYQFISPEDSWTSVNLSILIEGYMSFGFWGVIISSLAFAVFVAAFWALIAGRLGALGIVFVGIPFFVNIANSESGLAAVITGGLHAIAVYGLLILILNIWLGKLPGVREIGGKATLHI